MVKKMQFSGGHEPLSNGFKWFNCNWLSVGHHECSAKGHAFHNAGLSSSARPSHIHSRSVSSWAMHAFAWTILLALWMVQSVQAAPFSQKIQFKQPNGLEIFLLGQGDDFHAVFETLDGYTVVFDEARKGYCYAAPTADGQDLVSTGVLVGKVLPSKIKLAKHLRVSQKVATQRAQLKRQEWETTMKIKERWKALKTSSPLMGAGSGETALSDYALMAPPSKTTTGTKVGLTLLIDFDDDPATIPQAEIVNFCNGDSYSNYGNNGSVKQYFKDVSNNTLTYSNVVTVYIRIPNTLHPKSYYNDTTKSCGTQGNLLIKDAIAILKALPNYTTEILPAFSALTTDSSKRVVACNVFYAGGNGGVWSKGLWPHSYAMVSAGAQELSSGGMLVWNYQLTNIGSSLTLGTFCHENGHMLCGYPDLYDYGYDSKGVGYYCLMGYGGSGGNPGQICAYLKIASGWGSVTDLTSNSVVNATLSSTGTGFNKFYRYRKPGSTIEYFLLENRNKSGRDTILPGSGVAVWHIDEYGSNDTQSTTTNSTHANYEATLEQADNLAHLQANSNYGDAKDFYYTNNTATGFVNEFSDVTGPGASWWDGTKSGLMLYNFSAAATTMTFSVGLSAPVVVSEPATTPGTENTIDWSAGALAGNSLTAATYPVQYYAECSTSSSFTSPVNSGWTTNLQYTFTGLTAGQTYYYRVKAQRSYTLSAWSSSTQSAQESSGSPAITLSPASLSYGQILPGATKDLTFTVQNTGAGTLTGSATAASPFSVVSGGSYSLTAGQSQVVTIRFSPTTSGTFSGSVVFTGGVGSTNAVQGVANAMPTISTIANQTINEDGTTGAISFTVQDAETAAASLTVNATSSNTSLVPNANVVLGGSGTSRTVTITPLADQNGVTTITLSANDGVNTTTATFTVTVNAVNDIPAFTKGANVMVAQTTSRSVFNGWASGISAGAANESSQTLTFVMSSDHPEYFSAQPAVDFAGNLSFTPKRKARGTACVSIYLTDNGGTSNGGQSTTATQTFYVTIGKSTDTDGDGIPDDYEALFGLNPALAGDAALDSDGDGYTNQQEYLAATDPLDGKDVPEVSKLKVEGEDIGVWFPSSPGKHYRLERQDGFPSGTTNIVADNVLGTGEVLKVVDTKGSSRKKSVYRLVVLP